MWPCNTNRAVYDFSKANTDVQLTIGKLPFILVCIIWGLHSKSVINYLKHFWPRIHFFVSLHTYSIIGAMRWCWRRWDVTEAREGENNREAEKEGDEWRRKGARPQHASGRFQLVMETGVAHPAAVVTDLTCPPDIYLQSAFSIALQVQALLPFSIIYINLRSLPNTCFTSFLPFFLCTTIPFSLLPFSLGNSWALTDLNISFFSAAAKGTAGHRGPC